MNIIIGIVNTYFNIMVPGEGVEMIKTYRWSYNILLKN